MQLETDGMGHPNVSLASEEDFPRELIPVAYYYMRLLLSRKYLGIHHFKRFTATKGREPTPREIQTICQSVAGGT